jgi:hypothetical protein
MFWDLDSSSGCTPCSFISSCIYQNLLGRTLEKDALCNVHLIIKRTKNIFSFHLLIKKKNLPSWGIKSPCLPLPGFLRTSIHTALIPSHALPFSLPFLFTPQMMWEAFSSCPSPQFPPLSFPIAKALGGRECTGRIQICPCYWGSPG